MAEFFVAEHRLKVDIGVFGLAAKLLEMGLKGFDVGDAVVFRNPDLSAATLSGFDGKLLEI